MIKKEIVDYIKKHQKEWENLRHYFHQHPETSMTEYNTSNKIKELLTGWGYQIEECGKTGMIATLTNGNGNRKIAIRAEFDALKILELNDDLEYKSLNDNMHACGHDGHLTMALATCQYMAETRNFNGTFYTIFQPGEEDCVGALEMINDGLFERINPDRIYAIHNMPLKALGTGQPGDFHFYTGENAMMASNDMYEYKIIGKGAHGSSPQNGIDPVVAASNLVLNLQTIVSRNVSAFEKVVITVGSIHAGSVPNIIPQSATISLSIRNLDQNIQDYVLNRIDEVVANTCNTFNCTYEKKHLGSCCMTINNKQVNEFAKKITKQVFGEHKVHEALQLLAGEDYGYFLQKVPGCLVFLNNGDSADLHNPRYNFNDKILPYGIAYFISILEKELV